MTSTPLSAITDENLSLEERMVAVKDFDQQMQTLKQTNPQAYLAILNETNVALEKLSKELKELQ